MCKRDRSLGNTYICKSCSKTNIKIKVCELCNKYSCHHYKYCIKKNGKSYCLDCVSYNLNKNYYPKYCSYPNCNSSSKDSILRYYEYKFVKCVIKSYHKYNQMMKNIIVCDKHSKDDLEKLETVKIKYCYLSKTKYINCYDKCYICYNKCFDGYIYYSEFIDKRTDKKYPHKCCYRCYLMTKRIQRWYRKVKN